MQPRAMIVQKNAGDMATRGGRVLLVDAGSGVRVHSFRSSHVRFSGSADTISRSRPADRPAFPALRRRSDGNGCRERGEAFEATFRRGGWGGALSPTKLHFQLRAETEKKRFTISASTETLIVQTQRERCTEHLHAPM